LPFTQSRVGMLQLWDRLGLKVESVYSRDLTGGFSPEGADSHSQPESRTLQRLPQADMWGQTLLAGCLLADVNASAVDFQRSRTVDGTRLDIEPGATLPFPLGQFAFGSGRIALRETAYHLIDRDVMEDSTGRELPRNQSRELFEASAGVGTSFNRIYPFHWFGLQKLKHTLEPEITYLYVPSVSQGDLPLFDGVDRVNRRNLVTYGLVSRVLGRFSDPTTDPRAGAAGDQPIPAAAIRELGRLSLMQSYDVSRSIGPLKPGRQIDHFSDIDFGGRVNPSEALSVRFHTTYDVANSAITAAKVGFFVEDPRDLRPQRVRLSTRTSAGVSYRFQTQDLAQELQEVDSNIVVRLTQWAGFLYSNRYDVSADRFLDNFFGLRLTSTCDCWALDLAFTDRTNPQEVEFRAQLTLVGLGSTKPQSRVAAVP
jgi:LPS-assembly protein